jgi:hypothetical protein
MWLRNLRVGLLAIVTSIVFLASAKAKDFDVLTRVLYAAYLADQANAFCSLSIPEFSSSHAGPLGDMRSYMFHIKMEVTSRLSASDALAVSVSAANAAREHMRAAFREIRANGDDLEPQRTRAWCRSIASPLITSVISTHDEHHKEIDEILEKAMR